MSTTLWKSRGARKRVATRENATAVPNSTNGYLGEMRSEQLRHRPMRTSHETIGMLSYDLIGVAQDGHALAGVTTDMPSGIRWITTFRKEPMVAPRTPTAATTAITVRRR